MNYEHKNFTLSRTSLLGTSNGVLKWYPIDGEQEFIANLKKHPHNTSLQYYLSNPIEYRLNSHKLRTFDELTTEEPGNVFLGCSHTYGIGLHLQDTWAYKVNQFIGGKFWNFGLPGSSLQIAYMLLLHYHGKMKVKNVFVFHPHVHRYAVCAKDNESFTKWYNVSTYNLGLSNASKVFGSTGHKNYLSEEYAYINYMSLMSAIKLLCDTYGYSLYANNKYIHSIDMPDRSEVLEARDLTHYSDWHHTVLASEFIEQYNNQIRYTPYDEDLDQYGSMQKS